MKSPIEFTFDPILFMHPADRAMLTRLNKMSFVANMFGKITDFFCRQMEIAIMGSGIHVTEQSMPELYRTYRETADFFGIKNPPLLYLSGNPEINAYAMGTDRAFIVINESLLFRLTEAEQKFLMGHELAHIMAGHVKYKTLVDALIFAGNSIIPFADVAADITVLPALMLWSRRSEYTCDRAGILVAQDPEVAYSFFVKLSGFPRNKFDQIKSDVFMLQAEEFQQLMSGSMMDVFWAANNQIYSTHPRSVERAAEVKEWIDEGWVDEIVNGTPESRAKLAELLRRDPLEAEINMLIIRAIIAWAMSEFKLSREEVACPIRKALNENKTLQGTKVEKILSIEMLITPLKQDRIDYKLIILFNNNGSPKEVTLNLPLPESMDYTSDKIRQMFIKNAYNSVALSLYSVKDASK